MIKFYSTDPIATWTPIKFAGLEKFAVRGYNKLVSNEWWQDVVTCAPAASWIGSYQSRSNDLPQKVTTATATATNINNLK